MRFYTTYIGIVKPAPHTCTCMYVTTYVYQLLRVYILWMTKDLRDLMWRFTCIHSTYEMYQQIKENLKDEISGTERCYEIHEIYVFWKLLCIPYNYHAVRWSYTTQPKLNICFVDHFRIFDTCIIITFDVMKLYIKNGNSTALGMYVHTDIYVYVHTYIALYVYVYIRMWIGCCVHWWVDWCWTWKSWWSMCRKLLHMYHIVQNCDRDKTSMNQSFPSLVRESVGEFTIDNNSYFSESGI